MANAPVEFQHEQQFEGYTSAMVGCFLNREDAARLATLCKEGLSEAEQAQIELTPPEEMHLTLCYLGDEAKALEPYKMALIKNLKVFCDGSNPLQGKINGIGRFSADEGEGSTALYASFDCKGLPAWREALIEAIKASGVPYEDIQTHGFVPHITLGYLPKGAATPANVLPDMPLTLGQLSLCWGEKHMLLQLGAGNTDKNTAKTAQGKSKGESIITTLTKQNFLPSNAKIPSKTLELKRASLEVEFKALPGETVMDGQPGIFIEGWASVREPADRYGDIIGPTDQVFRDAVVTYFNLNPILLYEHGMDAVIGNKPLGQVVAYKFTDYGLWVKAFIRRPIWEPLLQIYLDIKSSILRTFSIGGIWSRQGSEIVNADLFEISVVATPAQPYAVFDRAAKSFKGSAVASKGATVNKNQLKKLLVAQALAGLDYWSETVKSALGAKYKTAQAREKAIKNAGVRLAIATRYFEKVTEILC